MLSKSSFQPPASTGDSLHSILSTALYHAKTIYLFSRNDIKLAIGTGYLFGALNASIAPQISLAPKSLSPLQILASTPAMLLWSWSHLLLFNIHNQRHPSSIAEDAINKPWRPLPAGRITPEQTNRLMYCVYALVLAVTATVGGKGPSLLELALCLWYNELGGSANPFLKNLLNASGLVCFFAGPLEVVTGHSVLFAGEGKVALWLLIIAGAITTTSHLQDFRDVEGDRLANRKTIPLLLGDRNARAVVAAGIPAWTAVACCLWGVGWQQLSSLPAWVAGGVTVGNVLCNRTQKGDCLSWKLFPLWLLGLFILPISS